ncbi:hypothetical protein RO3G_02218 [Rhizopus delemar RA 99-880]|uniref:Uncharacterized protein n=1 Tax=Rhizopus delemar (strain RA 99-880 / ATCC MYA-4621 / FGSC 9543 / NRRL 43880) TaxID=246409 RepID=I1BMT4_RHIO9|nr:hypothetical protein RO3G_02218 [Rhizopus delemar RA 99-880]|eukprot:EIE77514.1 hypothetical protein RO3G_02218 [Rhizopus delemar RA 99-880]
MSVPIYSPTSGSISSSTQPGLYEYLSELVSKRVATIKYIRKAHEGNTHWFNTILLTRENLQTMYPNSKMKNIFRKTKTDNSDNTGDYGYLILPHIPFEMDYLETFFTLIDIIAEAYYKLLVGTEGPICTQAFFELVLKCDGKFKKIVSMVTKELDQMARDAIKDELRMIDPISQATRTNYPIEFEGDT